MKTVTKIIKKFPKWEYSFIYYKQVPKFYLLVVCVAHIICDPKFGGIEDVCTLLMLTMSFYSLTSLSCINYLTMNRLH
ncbi:hypothetical protein F5148DRAFT_1190544 [Russula earlei]|uniref:Uncharacterized protein n=2 Tax=Russula earlei TaxID=71964 RepID=A0ACC0TS94_9AGAM|nr:hypothetical protein F5148DRAFT_1268707 [Russula earlei]KAI9509007.1 hypothetical protein F5148DRAFT_1190544 [Russula earlei]